MSKESMDSSPGCVIPWVYNNPRIDRRKMEVVCIPIVSRTIKIHQDINKDIDANRNTAYRIWDGSFLLAKHLENEKYFRAGYFKGKKCIELGAGCGLVSIAAWLLGASVVATDLGECLEHTKKCIETNVNRLCLDSPNSEHLSKLDGKRKDLDKTNAANKCCNEKTKSYTLDESINLDPEQIRVMPHCWGTDPSELSPPFDIILGSDVIYHRDHADSIIDSLNHLSHANTIIILSYKPRALGEAVFFSRLKKEGYQCQVLPKEDHPKEFSSSNYDLFHIYRIDNS